MHQRYSDSAVWFLLCFAIQIISQGLFPPWIKGRLFASSTGMEKYFRIYLQHRDPTCRLCAIDPEHRQTPLMPTAQCADVPSVSSAGYLKRRAAKSKWSFGFFQDKLKVKVWDLDCPQNWAENYNDGLDLHGSWAPVMTTLETLVRNPQALLKAKTPVTITVQSQPGLISCN